MGYSTLDERVTKAVADAMSQIDRLLASERFASLAFSWSHETKLGGRIFNTAQVVRGHIVAGLEAAAAKHNVALIRSQFADAGRDGDFNYMITRHPDVLFVFNDNEGEFYAHYNDSGNPYGASAGLQQQ